MTTEIDPSLNTYPHNYMEKTYQSARKDRLVDIVADYFTDEDTTAQDFYNDLVTEIDSWIDYHRKFLEKAKLVKKMVNGHRPLSFEDDTITNYSPQYLAEDILAL
jgi:hypothetical protein